MPTAHVAASAFAPNHKPKRSRGLPCRSAASMYPVPYGSIANTLSWYMGAYSGPRHGSSAWTTNGGPMISSNDFRNGVTIVIEGHLWTVIEFLHVKPGKGSAFVRTRLKNVKTGATVEKTFRAGEKLERATVDNRQMQMLYNDADGYHFMDQETFENVTLQRDVIGDPADFLKDGMVVDMQFHDANPIGADLPAHVELKVDQTDPGFKGDTATGTTKPATLETGAVV